MNTYILHADLHKELLAQNRIDPITGDSIQEGDEVVFCASCKSIFLKDTWEYLGEKHCNQNNTLNYIPSHSINLKLGDDILYYQGVQDTALRILEISPQMENWLYKESNTGKFHKYFFGEKEIEIKAITYVSFFSLFILVTITSKSAFFSGLFFILALGIYPFIRYIKKNEYKQKLTNSYKKISAKSFLIKPNGISICSPYGIKEIFLHSNKLKSITVSYLGTFFKKTIIFDYEEEKSISIEIDTFIDKDDFFILLKALGRLSQGLDFPITLYIKSKEKIEQANQLITEQKAKFTIETREEYLKKKYGYLYNYAEKIQKLIP